MFPLCGRMRIVHEAWKPLSEVFRLGEMLFSTFPLYSEIVIHKALSDAAMRHPKFSGLVRCYF